MEQTQKALENGLYSIPGTKTTIGLSAAKGKEPFYEKLGFERRPSDHAGAGMMKRFVVQNHED